jgi:hypothetical protein
LVDVGAVRLPAHATAQRGICQHKGYHTRLLQHWSDSAHAADIGRLPCMQDGRTRMLCWSGLPWPQTQRMLACTRVVLAACGPAHIPCAHLQQQSHRHQLRLPSAAASVACCPAASAASAAAVTQQPRSSACRVRVLAMQDGACAEPLAPKRAGQHMLHGCMPGTCNTGGMLRSHAAAGLSPLRADSSGV